MLREPREGEKEGKRQEEEEGRERRRGGKRRKAVEMF